jgi:hypothetical protein
MSRPAGRHAATRTSARCVLIAKGRPVEGDGSDATGRPSVIFSGPGATSGSAAKDGDGASRGELTLKGVSSPLLLLAHGIRPA